MLERSVVRRAQVRPLLADAWTRRAAITVADALYVVLAEHIGGTLVTADERLARSPGLTISTIVPLASVATAHLEWSTNLELEFASPIARA